MKRLLSIFAGKHQPDRDALSAYLDGELPQERASAVEAHVAACDACTSMLEGMREVRTMLRALPEADAPRSFRLRQADVEASPRRGVPAPPTPLMRLMPALSAAAVIVFAVAVSFDFASGTSRDANTMFEAAAQRTQGLEYSANDEAAPNAEDGAGAASPVLPAPGAVEGSDSGGEDDTEDPAAPDAPAFAERGSAPDADAASPAAGNVAPAATAEAIESSTAASDDGNNLTLRIVQIASAAVAIAAAGVALRMWRRGSERV